MMMTASNRSMNGSFAQANGSAFVRASFNLILFVIGAALAVSIFAISGLVLRALIIGILLVAVLILRVLLLAPKASRPGLSAA